MKASHIATLAVSCVAVGVLLSLLVQYKLKILNVGRKTMVDSPPRAAVLNPSIFSKQEPPIKQESPIAQPEELPPAASSCRSSAPPGSGERWTPLK